MKTINNEIKIWTDGSATLKGNKLGGSGVYMKYSDGTEKMFSQGWENTKTGRAEIHAFLIALSKLDAVPGSATFYMDSEYVIKSVTQYMSNWIRNNWIGSTGMVKNRDLWERVLKELNRTQCVLKSYIHVKGHQDRMDDETVYGNNVADYLANYKNQASYTIDLPLKERKEIEHKRFYYYDPFHNEVYVDKLSRDTGHINFGYVEAESEEEACELWQDKEMYLDFSHSFKYIGTEASSSDRCYYLHRPSKTYFVEEKGKDFGVDDVECIGDCKECCESELSLLLQREHKYLFKVFENYRLRQEITPYGEEELPF